MIRPYDERTLGEAIDALRRGELVAFPTETVYGLGARADDARAVAHIYEAKGRPPENPSIVHAADAELAFALALGVPDSARALAAHFWPGPLTLVVRARRGAVSSLALAGGETIALRVPSHPVALAILRGCGLPIAAPSANRSTGISPTTAAHVESSLGSEVFVVDGGETGFGIESTIVDLTVSPTVLLRRGSISLAALSEVAATVDLGGRVEPLGRSLRAPGSTARHYAPRTPTSLRTRDGLFAEIDLESAGFLLLASTEAPPSVRTVEKLPIEPVGYAHGLYAALHRLDAASLARIVVEEVPDTPAWAAVRDRLVRASST